MTRTFLLPLLLVFGVGARAAEPLHLQIDRIIEAQGKGKPASPLSGDAEFVRRVYLDLAGRIPSAAEARIFLADKAPDRRAKLIDRLLDGAEYPRHMAGRFHVLLMERLGDNADWDRYLLDSFGKNKPWDRIAREVLCGEAEPKGAAFFLKRRLEHYGENPIDYPGLAKDIGRLFLGVNLQCAQCHDHLFIDEYKQADFQGLLAFVRNVGVADFSAPAVYEKPTLKKLAFASVFEKVQKETGPRVPGLKQIAIPVFKPGEEWLSKPNAKTRSPGVPKFRTLPKLAEQVTDPANPAFPRNFANRVWYLLLGRGIVHPLDLHHKDNPPSHPELLDLLAKQAVARKYDIKALVREIARSRTYQRSSELPAGKQAPEPTSFLTAHEKRLSAEQLYESVLTATGETDPGPKGKNGTTALKTKFLKAFANPARDPEEDFLPSLRSALFLLNDHAILTLLTPKPGNLIGRASRMGDDRAVEELYLTVLTRGPTADERTEALTYLKNHAQERDKSLGQLAWALMASTEFCVNH
jgi:hypothetical protein